MYGCNITKGIQNWTILQQDNGFARLELAGLVVTDSYPDRARIQYIKVMDGDVKKPEVKVVAKVFAPFKYDNDTRCDLHPRWNHKGDKICFDSVFEGHRGLYIVDISDFNVIEDKEGACLTPLLSVIVPVYNVEQYLKRCTDSIINQTYKNLEIILVDDGSTDNCGQLCDEIASIDSRVKVIHKKNGGLSSARNAGIRIATGEFITFVDSDDWIDSNIYKKCMNVLKKYECDVVDFKAAFSDGKNIVEDKAYFAPVFVKNEEILYDYLYRGQTEKCPFSVCRKIYRKELYAQIVFPEGKVNEDIATNFKILQRCSTLIHISDVGYYYFQGNAESITSGMLKKKDFDLIDASKELCDLSKQYQDIRINNLAKVKLARSYFSLLAKAATGGVDKDISKIDIQYLTINLRKNFSILMKSPMPLNRKVFVTLASINYRCIEVPYIFLKKIRNLL